MTTDRRIISVRLPTNQIIHIDARELRPVADDRNGEEDVSYSKNQEDAAFSDSDFGAISDAIEGLAAAVRDAIDKAKPTTATVEFGVEVAVESGKLTALLVKGNGKANLKISLTWGG